jgi:hypothetical protein
MKSGKVEEGGEEEENKLTSLACTQEIHNNNLPPGAPSDGRRAPLALDGSDTTTPTAPVRMLKGRDDAGVLALPVREQPFRSLLPPPTVLRPLGPKTSPARVRLER